MEPNETDLPFVGRKTSLVVEGGERIDVVIYPDGTRDVVFLAPGADEPRHIARLGPASACALGALLCAALDLPSTG